MNTKAMGTLSRADKGPMAPAPMLDGPLRTIADTVSGWPGVVASVHWDLHDRSRVDGVDFYVNDEELGHLHLDGAIHLATAADLGQALIDQGLARAFRYQRGWVEEQVRRIGPDAAIDLFRRNYEHLGSSSDR